jgi:DNA invertase Pin-like site-specific DNA recombinase
MMSDKVTLQHRQRAAYIYIRQSTMGQVLHHPESTRRQYALGEKAMAMGWPPSLVRVLDRDLGLSAAQADNRDDFKLLVADVSMGRVGAVFALEVSRLARSCADWHRLIELCALTGTLLIDEDGCYDPSDFNDQLLLGLKATMSRAELHLLASRLHGGRRHKADRGELRVPLPVGLCYEDSGQVVLDPDAQVRGAVELLFRMFRELGSANAVARHFRRQGILYPRRTHGGATDGELTWGRLDLQRVLDAIKNPAYAGIYAYGQDRRTKEVSDGGEVKSRVRHMPRGDWLVEIRDHHPGYLTPEDYLENLAALQRNRLDDARLPGPVREGLASLHGLLICGVCGHRLTVRYKSDGGVHPYYECHGRRQLDPDAARCLRLRGDLVDRAVADRMLEVAGSGEIGLALQAFDELRGRRKDVDRQWQLQVQRAEYEVDLARRRYEQVDPANRLVAASLERRWEEAMARLEAIRGCYAEFQASSPATITEGQRERILALVDDLPRLWHASATSPRDKKRIIRLLVKDITVEKRPGLGPATLHVRWQGGAYEDLVVRAPSAHRLRYPPEVLARIRALSADHSDEEIAAVFNEEGLKTPHGRPFARKLVRQIRYHFKIPTHVDRRPGELSPQELAARLGIRPDVVYYWIQHGTLAARQQRFHSPYWIPMDSAKEQELRAMVQASYRIRESHNPQSENRS